MAARAEDLATIKGIKQQTALALTSQAATADAQQELDRCRQAGIVLISLDDHRYPELLRHIACPPPVLWAQGDVTLMASEALAIVGSRAASSYGLGVAEHLSKGLTGLGITVVSGLALGIDAAAHRGCLQTGGKTIGVLACGLDRMYPAANQRLRDQIIAANGLVVSEYPLGTAPEPFRFPARNRIISGLSKGVLVVEAAARSGSLITANLALEQGREVFAIPGRIDSGKSAGSHRILQQGAKLVHCLDDILEEIPLWNTMAVQIRQQETSDRSNTRQPQPDLSPAAVELLALLDEYPQDIDTIIRLAKLPAQEVAESLLLLELAGLVEAQSGNQYRRLCPTFI